MDIRPFVERLKSRKFIMALVAAAVAGTKVYYPDLPEDAIYTVVGALMGYVAVEGAVDAAAQLAKWAAERNKNISNDAK
ncbi:conserved hypothetical protein [Desulforamulus reducens MI-1]|uniref:Uncharacterized protein n=1 Tax=Desulforamulus reducens (strain ATCC BAA-1160 / DSM 100696 / MI-1) TaxID=349161 RepID=A4J7P5_DESRM|nr:hypothetical protein [Desulforamulus reducens]ABO51098.1 conserved hypothetical protein [Desulforamulus reducens MI-1]